MNRVISSKPDGDAQIGIVYQQGKHIIYSRYALDSFNKLGDQVATEVPESL